MAKKSITNGLLSKLNDSIMGMNNSKFFAGLMMIILNVCSKYITLNLSDAQEELLKNVLTRELLIFAVIWMGTHDIYISITMTAAFAILANVALNENSAYCIIPHKFKKIKYILDTNKDGEISDMEIKNAEYTLSKAKKQNQKIKQMEMMNNMRNKLY